MVILFLIVFISQAHSYNLNGPYQRQDGSCISNLGHRLGGDFKGLKDNRIESAKAVKFLEMHKCFKGWELDLNSTRDGVIVRHDYKNKDGRYIRYIPKRRFKKFHDLNQIIGALIDLNTRKPIFLDIKEVSRKHWGDVINAAIALNNYSLVKVIISKGRKNKYHELINSLTNVYIDVGYY